MPTYTYQCDTCGHGFDTVQRFADDPLTECPQCGAPIRRVIQPVGVVFKGSGWYINDSRPSSSSDSGDSSSRPSPKTSTEKEKTTSSEASEKVEKPAKAEATATKAAD